MWEALNQSAYLSDNETTTTLLCDASIFHHNLNNLYLHNSYCEAKHMKTYPISQSLIRFSHHTSQFYFSFPTNSSEYTT